MGTCTSTSNHAIGDPITEKTFKRSHKSLEGSIDNYGSNSSRGATEIVGVDSYDNDKDRIQLYEAVYQRNWSRVTEILTNTKSRHNSDYIDRDKRTCLHWACIRSAPPSITQNLITSFIDAILMQDHLGKTPLHLACEFGSPGTIYHLLGLSSQVTSLRDTENGRTPLAEAIICRRSYPIIESLLESNPKQINIPDMNGNKPTDTFFRMTLGLFITFTGKAKGTWNCCNENIHDLIEIARLLLHAENWELDNSSNGSHPQDHIDANQDGNILHDAINSPTCPLAFVEFLLSHNPELADEVNRAGNLPIHVAAALTPDFQKELSTKYKCNGCGKPQSDNDVHYYRCDPSVLFRQILCNDCISESQICKYKKNNSDDKMIGTIRALLSIKPQYANEHNQRDMTPLNIAIKSRHNWDEEIWDEIIGGKDKITTLSRKVEIESNHENSITETLKKESVPIANDSLSSTSDNSVTDELMSSIDSSKFGTTELRSDNSLQVSLSSIGSVNDVVLQASITEDLGGYESLEGDGVIDDSSLVSIEKSRQSTRTQLDVQIEEIKRSTNSLESESIIDLSEYDSDTDLIQNKLKIDQLEDEESKIIDNRNTDTGRFMSTLRSSLVTSQGLSFAIEIGCAALT